MALPKPCRIAMSFALKDDAAELENDVFEVLDHPGLAPQKVSTVKADPAPVTCAPDFTSRWLNTGESRSLETNAPSSLHFGSSWSRQNAPQGWGALSHRLGNVKGRKKRGRISLDLAFSPQVDRAAAFGEICRTVNPITPTFDAFRRETRSTFGFARGYPFPARPKRECTSKPIQVPRDPDDLKATKATVKAALPDVFDVDPKFVGYP